MESILAAGGDAIPLPQWRTELNHAASFAFAPVNVTSTHASHHYAISSPLRQSLSRLLSWACGRIDSELAIEALRHASACAHFVVLQCCAVDIPCCFTGSMSSLHQVCFCYMMPNGTIHRTLFFAMDERCVLLVYCFYLIGHVAQYTLERVQCIIASNDDWCESINAGIADDLADTVNQCTLVLHEFITRPPCGIRSA